MKVQSIKYLARLLELFIEESEIQCFRLESCINEYPALSLEFKNNIWVEIIDEGDYLEIYIDTPRESYEGFVHKQELKSFFRHLEKELRVFKGNRSGQA